MMMMMMMNEQACSQASHRHVRLAYNTAGINNNRCALDMSAAYKISRLPSNLGHLGLTDHPRIRAFSNAWSLTVTWQRWRSHHSIRHSWKPHDARKLLGSNGTFYRTGVIIQWGSGGFSTIFAPPSLTLTRWPLYMNLALYLKMQKKTSYVKAFESYRIIDIHTYIQTDKYTPPKLYTTPLRGWSTIF